MSKKKFVRSESHEEIVEVGEVHIAACKMEIESLELSIKYFELLVDKSTKFDRAAYQKIEDLLFGEDEIDQELFSIENNIPIERVSKMVEVAKGVKRSDSLSWSATRYRVSIMDKQARLDDAYIRGVAIGLLETGMSLDEISKRTELSVNEIINAIKTYYSRTNA